MTFLYTTLKLSLTFPQLLSAPSVQWIYGKRESFFRAAVSEPCARGVWCMRHGDPWVTLSVCFQFHISFPLPLSLCSKTICTYDTLLCVGCIHNVVLRKRKKKKKKNSLFCSVPERRAQVLAAPWGALTAWEWGIVKLETLGIDGQAKKGNHARIHQSHSPTSCGAEPSGRPAVRFGDSSVTLLCERTGWESFTFLARTVPHSGVAFPFHPDHVATGRVPGPEAGWAPGADPRRLRLHFHVLSVTMTFVESLFL